MSRAKDRIKSRSLKRDVSEGKTRNARPGLYVIFVDAEKTERNYFSGLSQRKGCPVTVRLEKIRKIENAINEIQIKEKNLRPYKSIWLVFDRDEVAQFDQIISEAEKLRYCVGWSNPCFEIWLHAYFGKMPPAATSIECVNNFKREFKRKTEQEYKKNDPKIFDLVEKHGDFDVARETARKAMLAVKDVSSKPSEQSPATTVYELVEKLHGL